MRSAPFATTARSLALAASFVLAPVFGALAQEETHTPAPLMEAVAGKRPLTAPTPAEELAPAVNVYRQHVFTLANPFMEGREPSTKGSRIAADYVQFNFNRLGLKPAFTNGDGEASWRQPFAVRGKDKRRLANQSLSAGDMNFESGKDFNALGYSASGEVEGTLAFVGYGIRRGENGYTSYEEGTDLTGKIAMVLRFEPMKEDGTSKWNEDGWSARASLSGKLQGAASRKAAGIILVNAPGAKDDRLNELGGLSMGDSALKIPVVMMSIDAADKLIKSLDQQGRSLLDLRKLADEQGGVIDLDKSKIKLSTQIERDPLMTDNIGGILEGRGALKDEIIVIGAHYDHVGYGTFGSMSNSVGKLHPGADDNASGTSAMLVSAQMLADAYAALPENTPARSVLFLAFGAEESGLEGSAYYASNPITSVEKHYMMLNLDMVGRLRDGKLEVGGVASGEGMEEWLDPYWQALEMKIKTVPVGPPNSDHYSFHAKKIPNLFFFSGFHPQYHRPADTADLINCEGGVQIADVCSRITLDAATRATAMPFSNETSSRRPRVENQENDEQPAQRPSRGGLKVRFGIAPGDYTGETKGVAVGEVMENLPAQKAGLKSGDLMTKWNGVEIDSVETWMKEMGKNNPGDKVNITYIRDGKEMTTVAELVGRS